MTNKHFTLTAACPADAMKLKLTYADGGVFEVDVAQIVKKHPSLERIQKVFSRVKLGDHGLTVIWDADDELELSADNLRARAIEQAGGYSHETIFNWMARHHLTLEQAADELGLSRHMLNSYRSGTKSVPKTVGLACLGWEQLQRKAAGT